MIPDLINGLFELAGALSTALNLRRLLRDKCVRGFVPHLGWFYTLWALYNLYFYPHLQQWFSFTGGCCILVSNLAYTLLALYYSLNQAPIPECHVEAGDPIPTLEELRRAPLGTSWGVGTIRRHQN